MDSKNVRTYLDDVPEDVKEELSRAWGERKQETYGAAGKHGINIEQGESFNRVVTFELPPGHYRISSEIVSVEDISPEHSDIGALCSQLMGKMIEDYKDDEYVPLFASNICDWDSAYAKEVGANVHLRDSVINSCIENDIVLTGGETANLGDQVRGTGMGWMFTLLGRHDGQLPESASGDDTGLEGMDKELYGTFDHIADSEKFGIVVADDTSLLHVKKQSKFVMTADGTGSKSIVCERVNKRTDIYDTLAMCCDDATREGAFPIIGTIGIHAENSGGKEQIVSYMNEAGKNHMIPMIGCVYHVSPDVSTYITNGVVLSEVREETARIGKDIEPGISLVILYEEQRSNGITMQRRIFSETFGEDWHGVSVYEAFEYMKNELGEEYEKLEDYLKGDERTLGQLVAQPSTPYFRTDSMMPEKLLDTVKFRINVSSGGLIGKTERLLEPFELGAEYSDVYDTPNLVLLLQMATKLKDAKGEVPDEVAYSTWGCGVGAVIGTTDPDAVVDYYDKNGVMAMVGGYVTKDNNVTIKSTGLDSILQQEQDGLLTIVHEYGNA
jgi:phosphoribosylaminoimidazole (AIR) synthetase